MNTPTSKNYMMAVCDILGFANLVKELQLYTVVDNTLVYFRKALYHAIHQNDIPDEPPSLEALSNQNRIGFAWFSDTALFYTLNDTEAGYRTLLETVSWLLFDTMWSTGCRIRAGISYGEAYIDPKNGIYVGKVLVEAHELEKKQEWSGGALTKAAEACIPNEFLAKDNFTRCLTHYDVPLKGDATERMLAIDWTTGIHDEEFRLLWSKDSDKPTQEDIKERPALVGKWRNTIKFHEDVCTQCKNEN